MINENLIAKAIHYPECWDVACYPDLESALSELIIWSRCNECGKLFSFQDEVFNGIIKNC